MAYTQLEYFLRGSPPNIYFTYSYELARSGANVLIRFKTDVSAVTGASYFSGYLNQTIVVDGVAYESNATVKAQGVDKWSAFSHITDQFTIPNKTTGNLAIVITSTTNDVDFTSPLAKNYSVAVPAAASVIGTVDDFNFEDSFTVPVTKYDASFTDTLTIKIGDTLIKTVADHDTDTAVTLTDAEILAAYNALEASTATVTFTTTTKNGETTIGTSTKTATGTAAGTVRLNVGGTWKRCVVWVNVSGAWKRAVMHINVAGTWKRGV